RTRRAWIGRFNTSIARADGIFFFFSSRRRHTRSKRDWSSDVCSSDLPWKKRMDFCQEEEEKEQGQAGAEGYERIREKELLEQIFRLPRKYRVPIYLYYYEEYSVADRSEERRVGKESV